MHIAGKERIKTYNLSLMEKDCGGKSPVGFFFPRKKEEPSSKKRVKEKRGDHDPFGNG